MKLIMRSMVLALGFISASGFAVTPAEQVIEQACTLEAKQICVATKADSFKSHVWVSIGRIGPNCEFPTLPYESHPKNCQSPLGPQEPVFCTLDARVACVKTADETYEVVELGRLGPNCDFPILPSEVAGDLCTQNSSQLR